MQSTDESRLSNLELTIDDLTLYSQIIINQYGPKIATAIDQGIGDLKNTLHHPIDNLLYPLGLLYFDTAVMTFKDQSPMLGLLPAYSELLSPLTNNIYDTSCERMKQRYQGTLKEIIAIQRDNGPEVSRKIVRFLINVYVPSVVINGFKGAVFFKKVGTFNPPLYQPRRMGILKQIEYWLEPGSSFESTLSKSYAKSLWVTIDDIRNTIKETHYSWAITEDGVFRAIPGSRGGHDMIAFGKKIIAGGNMIAKNNLVYLIDNESGTYVPRLEPAITKHVLSKLGLFEVLIPGVLTEEYTLDVSRQLGMRRGHALTITPNMYVTTTILTNTFANNGKQESYNMEEILEKILPEDINLYHEQAEQRLNQEATSQGADTSSFKDSDNTSFGPYSEPVQNLLRTEKPESLRNNLELQDWIRKHGTKADKALLYSVENFDSWIEESEKLERLSIKETAYKRQQRAQELKQISDTLAQAANFAAVNGNENIARYLGAASGIASIGAGFAAGISWSGAGFILGGLTMLVSAFSKRSKGDGGIGKALQSIADLIIQLGSKILNYVGMLFQQNHDYHVEEMNALIAIGESIIFAIQHILHIEYDMSITREITELVLDNQYQEILGGAENYGEDKRTPLSILTPEEFYKVIRKYIPELKLIIAASYKPYHTGELFYKAELNGYKEELINDLYKIYKEGQTLGYFAKNYFNTKAPLSQDCTSIPNINLRTEAVEHFLRLNAYYSPDDETGKDLRQIIEDDKTIFSCISSMQAHKNHLFNVYFQNIIDSIDAYKKLYEYPEFVTDVVNMRYWDVAVPANLTITDGLVARQIEQKLVKVGRHAYDWMDELHTQVATPYTDFRPLIPGEFLMLSAAGLGGFHVQYVGPEYDWQPRDFLGLKYGRKKTESNTRFLTPHPKIWFTYNNGSRVDFRQTKPSPGDIPFRSRHDLDYHKKNDQEWETQTEAVDVSRAIELAIDELKQFRKQAVEEKQREFVKIERELNLNLTMNILKTRILCFSLGMDFRLCRELLDIRIDKTVVTELFEKNIQAGNETYITPLLTLDDAFLTTEKALHASMKAFQETDTFRHPHHQYMQALHEQAKQLLENWQQRPRVQGISEEAEVKDILREMLKRISGLEDKISKLTEENQKLKANGLFVNAVSIYPQPSWSCVEVDNRAFCESPDTWGLRRDMVRLVNKPWQELNTSTHCMTDYNGHLQCNGQEISYVEYSIFSKQTLGSAFINGAFFTVAPEAVGDLFCILGLTSARRAEQIKSLINFGLLLCVLNCVDGFLQNFVTGYIIGVAIACFTSHTLEKAGFSSQNARIMGNTLGFFVNLERNHSMTSEKILSVAYLTGSKLGLYAYKKLREGIHNDSQAENKTSTSVSME